MIEIESSLNGYETTLYKLETALKPIGFSVGGGWEYDHGYFDYRLAKEGCYYYVRLPFKATTGLLDRPGVEVKIGVPFLLGHQYEDGIDKDGEIGNISAAFNQFQSPKDADSDIPEEYQEQGINIIRKAETAVQVN
ncbi:YugN family protein [Jeotgalibacillus sp. ET6]|uniref:YugN family protein n=1 Tax=Jeotgalibacillus sp. ET6 TaxID=3037260 RepID=UPI0024184657|nr:YugN family protein [Jeotgalibacillus sp. ET6]MDG5471829.1 YugN family protein [Jeotgalibacillus sp. ET6]